MDNPFISYYHFKKCADELRQIAEIREARIQAKKKADYEKENRYYTYNPNNIDEWEGEYNKEFVEGEVEDYKFLEMMFSNYNLSNDVLQSLKLFYQKENVERVVSQIAIVLAEEFEEQKVIQENKIKEFLDDMNISSNEII